MSEQTFIKQLIVNMKQKRQLEEAEGVQKAQIDLLAYAKQEAQAKKSHPQSPKQTTQMGLDEAMNGSSFIQQAIAYAKALAEAEGVPTLKPKHKAKALYWLRGSGKTMGWATNKEVADYYRISASKLEKMFQSNYFEFLEKGVLTVPSDEKKKRSFWSLKAALSLGMGIGNGMGRAVRDGILDSFNQSYTEHNPSLDVYDGIILAGETIDSICKSVDLSQISFGIVGKHQLKCLLELTTYVINPATLQQARAAVDSLGGWMVESGADPVDVCWFKLEELPKLFVSMR